MLQGIPARIAERLWPRERAVESQGEILLDATTDVWAERGLRPQEASGRGERRVGGSISRELSDEMGALTNLDGIGALPLRFSAERADGEAGVTVVLGRFGELVRRGLIQLLSEDRHLQIIGVDLDDIALEHTVARQSPHVVILDEATIFKSSVIERLRTARPTSGIVVLAHHPTVAFAMQLMAREASCLAKDVSAAGVLAAVHIAADGKRVFADVDGHLVERSSPTTAVPLTPREVEVMEYLARGQSHREIAHALQLGVETVRTHSAHIRAKLGVRSKRELIGLTIPLNGDAGL